jgi:XTP/dITP diphosphohydrolase
VKLVVGSRNAHKLRELEALLAPHELEPLPDGVELPPETGSTFAENAIAKARAGADALARPALGEDSGIVVNALGGAPGIRSARFAGENASDEQNLELLLERMRDRDDRRAAYVCALAFAAPEGGESLFEGRCTGVLARAPRGSGGFGYDPIFEPDGAPGVTMAELPARDKDAISHRGDAARKLRTWLETRR